MTWKSSEIKEFLVLMDQCNIEIYSCFLRLLPLYSSTFHQTNVESAQIRSEDNFLISRIQSLHLLPEVDDHDEEVLSCFGTGQAIGVRGALLAKGPDSSLVELHKGSCSEDIHMEEEKVEVKVQEDEVEDGRDK